MRQTHKHHIIPKHAGGTNDPANIIELTIEEHAEAHRVLFEKYGRWQDEIAWKTLAGFITCDEASKMAQKNARFKCGKDNWMYGKSGENSPHYGVKRNDEAKRNISIGNTGVKRRLSKRIKVKKAATVAENRKKFLESRFANINFSNAQELYDGGMSYKNLAVHYGVSTGKIQGLGLKTRSYKDAGKIHFIKNPVSDETRKRMSVAAVLTHKSRKEK